MQTFVPHFAWHDCKACVATIMAVPQNRATLQKGAVHTVSNYRGLHLTPILSKVAERVLRMPLVSFFEAVNAYGGSQVAFRKQIGCEDLLLILMCAWLLAFQNRHTVGAFLGDIAGAFDRVDMKKLIAKL